MLPPIGSKINYNSFFKSNKVDELCRLINDNSTDDAIKCIKNLTKPELEMSDSKTKLCPLHIAILKENTKIIDYLFYKGVDPNIKNKKGKDAYHYAVQVNNVQIISLIENYYRSSCFCTIV